MLQTSPQHAGPPGKVAFFIDAENLAGWLKRAGPGRLLGELASFGPVIVRRAYGKWTSGLSAYQGMLTELGFELVHTYHPVSGKNSTDIRMTVDVMEYAARLKDLKWLVIATGDSDFSPLFRRLREMGKQVVGVGPRGPLSDTVKSSCTRFFHTDAAHAPEPLATAPEVDDAAALLEAALRTFDGPANLSTLKNRMLDLDSAFDERTLGYNRFIEFVRSSGLVSLVQRMEGEWLAEPLGAGQYPNASDLDASVLVNPYLRDLRARSWRMPSVEAVLSAWETACADATWRTRVDLIERMIEEGADELSPADLRKAYGALFKAHLFELRKGDDGETLVRVRSPEREVLDDVDSAMLSRALGVRDGAVPEDIDREALLDLLLGASDPVRLDRLLAEVEAQEAFPEDDPTDGGGCAS